MNVKIGVTSRHIHLSEDDLYELFGNKYKLNKLRDLTQDKNFSCVETVDLINGDNKLENVRIVGPVRNKTQVEISKTDAYILNLNPPIRNSGELDDAEVIKIRGPKGIIERKCCIIQTRHIHINEQYIEKYNLNINDTVKVKLFGEKGGIIDNVHLKISNNNEPELHLDLDDSNAHLIKTGEIARILEE